MMHSIIVTRFSPGTTFVRREVDTFDGGRDEAIEYAQLLAMSHAINIFGVNHAVTTLTERGAWFETSNGTLVRYHAEAA